MYNIDYIVFIEWNHLQAESNLLTAVLFSSSNLFALFFNSAATDAKSVLCESTLVLTWRDRKHIS